MAGWTYRAVDPCTGLAGPIRPLHGEPEIEARLAAAWGAWRDDWSRRSLEQRAVVLRRLARALREGRDRFAARMADEVGKPLAEGRAEIDKCAHACEHAASRAPDWLAPEPLASDAERSWVRYEPLGLVLAIMPWNFPFWQVIRFGASALMAGDGFLLKHAPGTPGCADDLEAVLVEAGLPPGLCPQLRLDEAGVERVLADPRVAAVTLTGSTRAGRAVAALAGRHLKKAVLELGGSDPFVVLQDADVDAAARTGARSRLLNGGQSCIAAKRFVVVEAVADRFVERLQDALAAAVVGDPRDPTTTVGPMARGDLRDALHDQVRRSIAAGARCVLGGEVPEGPGFFYPPTLLLDAGPGQPCWDEETFGPVAAVRVVPDEAAAIAAANDTAYGLGASLWTADPERAWRLAAELRAGCVFVNDLVRSDPRLPFGGTKDSGLGRELGPLGMRELTNPKTVWVGRT